MQRFIIPGTEDVSVVILALDVNSGTPLTTMDSTTPGLSLWYRRQGASKVAISPSDLASLTAAHSDGGMYHIGDGYYRLDVADGAFVSDADDVLIGGTATDVVIVAAMFQLDSLGEDMFDAAMSGHDTPSTIGGYISRISTGRITVASLVDMDGDVSIVPGHDYANADGNALLWTNTGEDWPDLSGSTITFVIHNKLTKAGAAVNEGNQPQGVRVDLTDTETGALSRGRYRFKVTATISNNIVLLVYGVITVASEVAAPS